MKPQIILIALAALFVVCAVCPAQTNPAIPADKVLIGYNQAPAVQTSAPAINNEWATTVAEDARKLVFDFLSGISLAGVGSSAFLLYWMSKGVRNRLPIDPAGKIAAILNFINLERKPLPPAQPSSEAISPAKTTSP